MKKHSSPCINVCKFCGKTKWCIACGRTLSECKQWKNMKPFDKNNITKELKNRLKKMKNKKKQLL